MSTTISASLVKELRDLTGAGMMECKRALQETGGDVEAARTLLREKGMAQAGKRADRATKEGLVGYHGSDERVTMVAVGCETEPVSKNDEFQAFARKVLDLVAASGPCSATRSSTLRANAWNSSFFETGSVSQPTATIVTRSSLPW